MVGKNRCFGAASIWALVLLDGITPYGMCSVYAVSWALGWSCEIGGRLQC